MCGLLVRRSALEALGGMADEFTGLHDDQVLYTKMSLHLRAVLDGRPTALYRQHADSMCAVAIDSGAWDPTAPNAAEDRFLEWLSSYVAEHVTDQDVLAVVEANVGARGVPPEGGPSGRTWSDRIRSRVPQPVRTWVGARRHRSTPPPRPTVIEAWIGQYLASWSPMLDGRILLAGAGRADEAGRSLVAALRSTTPGELVGTPAWEHIGGRFDHVVVLPQASEGRPEVWLRSVQDALRGSGRVLALVLGRDGHSGPEAPTGEALACAARRLFPTRTVTVEVFGSRATAAMVAAGGAASDVRGVGLDRHEHGVEVLLALAISS